MRAVRWRCADGVRLRQTRVCAQKAVSTIVAEPAQDAAATTSTSGRSLPPIAVQTGIIRSRVSKEHLGGGLLYLEAGDLVTRNNDVHHRFRPDSNFAYCTGISKPGYACLIDTESGAFTLLAPKQPDEAAFWTGPQPPLDHLAQQHGAHGCAYTTDLPALLQQHKGRDVHTTAGLARKVAAAAGVAPAAAAAAADKGEGQGQAVSTTVAGGCVRVIGGNVELMLQRCRVLKTEHEVECLRQANAISARAHREMWRRCRPGMYEYQLEAAFTAACMEQGALLLGYPCIVGAGRNAGVLHYDDNSSRVGPQDLVLCDAGAEVRHYTADITRTFPASGTFTPQQRDVYCAVLEAQEHALPLIRPGALWRDIEQASRAVLLSRLQDMGLVSQGASTEALLHAKVDRVFMPHGLGHFLGLDVHDCSSEGPVPKSELRSGYALTCEPGCYFIPPLVAKAKADPDVAPLINFDLLEQFMDMGGVRIEDNVVLPPDGSPGLVNLSTESGLVPKRPDLVEQAMRG